MSDELIDTQSIAEMIGVTDENMRLIVWKDKSFPPFVKRSGGRGRMRLWKKSDVLTWIKSSKRYKKQQERDASLDTLIQHFLSGKFDRQEQQLNYLSKRQLARLNNHTSTRVHVEGVYLCRC